MVREAAEPHAQRGKRIVYDGSASAGDSRQPVVERRPEMIHGLRNLVQNAVDFAATTVWIDSSWTDDRITVRIADDGPGFPPSVLTRIGDPFVRRRRGETDRGARPEYEGMGLGLFIAKTLLERTGAELGFTNGSAPGEPGGPGRGRTGAIVTAAWPRMAISPVAPGVREVLGENLPIEA